jgi:hypothetical protein
MGAMHEIGLSDEIGCCVARGAKTLKLPNFKTIFIRENPPDPPDPRSIRDLSFVAFRGYK